MAAIDFSFDSRIRKTYVPLINQQRYFRHVKRIAARNLSIPETLLNSYLYNNKRIEKISIDQEEKDNDETILYSKLNIVFYFTIHHPSIPKCPHCKDNGVKKNKFCNCGKLLYRSEYIMSANPSWKSFEGSSLCSPSISQFIIRIYFVHLDSLEIKNRNKLKIDYLNQSSVNEIINNNHDNETGILFLEWNVNLTGLLYIGEEFPKDRRLTKNSIIFGFAEGFYTSVCSIASEILLNHSIPPSESLQIFDQSLIRNSYCLNTLIRIQMVQCILQTTASQVKMEQDLLEQELEKSKEKHELLNEIEKIKSSIEFLTMVSERRQQKLKDCKLKIEEIDEKLLEYNMDMSSKLQILKEEFNLLNELRMMKLVETSRKLEKIVSSLAYQRKLLVRKFFQDIYMIVPFPDGIGYSINNIYLPSSECIDQHQHKMISIGLGYVAQLIYFLSIVLDIFLFHQIIPYGSRSFILDPYNNALKNHEKIVPLYSKSKSNLNTIFFKHGWNLLNRLIIFIRQSMGLCTQDSTITLCNVYSLYTNRFMPDNCFISEDDTLNRFNSYSPSIDSRLHNSNDNQMMPDSVNQKLLSDIDQVKINDYMLDYLWKEVEQMTLNSIKNETHSSQQSFTDEIKEIIGRQRHQKKMANAERLSQLTSLLTYSQASSSFDLTPNLRSSMIQTSPPQSITEHHRRLSITQCSLSSDGTFSPSMFRLNGHCTFQQFNSMKRIRSISGYGQSPQSLPSNNSFLYTRNVSEPGCSNPPLSMSLDNGLDLVQNQNHLIHSKTTSESTSINSNPIINVKLLNVDSDFTENDNTRKDSFSKSSASAE